MAETATEKVCSIRARVADRIGSSRFRTWFGAGTRFRLNGDHLAITVANPFVGTWITSNYMKHLVEAAQEVIGSEPRVDVHVSQQSSDENADEDEPAPEPQENAPGPVSPTRRTAPRAALRGNLDSFVVGASNELAYSAARNLARQPGDAFRLLVVHGGCGLGKTHLLHGVCNALTEKHPALEWCYISGEEFTNEFVYAVKSGRVDAFRARFRQVDVLIIDDIHFLANKKATQEEFLHTFNAVDNTGKAIVLSSDRHPRSIATLSDPLINRLISGMVVQIDPPDLGTRTEILRRRARAMNADLPEEVLTFLARRIQRNVRELEGALYKLVALSSLTKERITLNMAQIVAEDYAEVTKVPGVPDIERIVATYFGITREAIHSRARDRTVSLARGLAMFLARKHTSLSFPEIGRVMGNKNHSTVLMAVRRIEQTLAQHGAVAWRTPSGLREATLTDVIAELEHELARRD